MNHLPSPVFFATSHVLSSHSCPFNPLSSHSNSSCLKKTRSAVHPPALVILSYTPSSLQDPNKTPSIVLVGKGIVFDTGGLQIKNKPGMLGMKRDMGGAAAILCAFGVAVRSHKPINRPLHAILCLAENAVATHATRADDILHMHSGKTVEINNTDAEGM
jgi:probable aminopeptidase NPEPL1